MKPCDHLPSFSVIVPTYQRRDLVCEAVEAIGRLEYEGAIEIVVVVDGSTDGTVQALSAIRTPFPFRIVEQTNGGLAAARNAGAAAASGEVLLFLDDDMICAPDLVRQHARSYAEGADAVVGEIPLDTRSPRGFLTEGISSWATKAAAEARQLRTLTPFNVFGGQISIRAQVFAALGGFDSGFTRDGKYGLEDADIAVRLLDRFEVRHNPDAISYHRYVVEPREYLRRGFELGRANVRFAQRHLAHAATLFELNYASHPATRLLIRPMGSVPGLHLVVAAVAARAAQLILATRWRSSRLFARLFFACRMVGFWAGVRAAGGVPDADRAIVLCYHAIADHRHDRVLYPFSVPEPQFRRQIDSLEQRGFVFVSADDLLQALDGNYKLPRRAVLLTFDDCYEDLLGVARDILHPKDIPAVAFAVTGIHSFTNEWDHAGGADCHRLLGWTELADLARHGVEVGSHSRRHRSLPTLSDEEVGDEASGSANDFEANGLRRPRLFCYPFGEVDPRVRGIVGRSGYAAAFGLRDRHAGPGSHRFDLPRVEIRSTDSAPMFWLKTTTPRIANRLRLRAWLGRFRREMRRLSGAARRVRQGDASAT